MKLSVGDKVRYGPGGYEAIISRIEFVNHNDGYRIYSSTGFHDSDGDSYGIGADGYGTEWIWHLGDHNWEILAHADRVIFELPI